MKSRRPSLKQIAKQAGVSHVTVSLALRNHHSIPQKTCKRIQKIAQSLGYQRDPELSKLMARMATKRPSQYKSNLGWIISTETEEEWPEWAKDHRLWYGAEERASELGYRLERFWIKDPNLSGKRASTILKSRGIEGFIISSPPDGVECFQPDFDWSAFSSVLIGDLPFQPQLHRVSHTYFDDMIFLVQKLKTMGFTRLGFVLSNGTDQRVKKQWRGAFNTFLDDQPSKNRIPILKKDSLSEKEFLKWVNRYLPEVVIANDYPLNIWLEKGGWKAPQNIGHVRMDNMPDSVDYQDPRWTPKQYRGIPGIPWGSRFSGIDQHAEKVGAAAVEAVVAQLHRNEAGIPSTPKHILIQGSWNPGTSLIEKSKMKFLRTSPSAKKSK